MLGSPGLSPRRRRHSGSITICPLSTAFHELPASLVFLLYQKGRDSRIFQAQDGYDRRDSEQQQVTADEEGAAKSFLPGDKRKLSGGQNMRYPNPRTAWSRLAPAWVSTSIDSRRLL